MKLRQFQNLFFKQSDIKNYKTKSLLSGVVKGIGDYGNSVGNPTVGGECFFHECYNNNILVNAMSVGLVKKNNFELHFPKELTLTLKFFKLLPSKLYFNLVKKGTKFQKKD